MTILGISRFTVGVLAVGAFLSVTACRKDNAAATDTSSAPGAVATPAPAPAAAISVVDVDMGKAIGADKKITDKTDDFAPTDQIYASVHTSGTGSGSLTARWTFENGTVVDERTENISPTGDAYTEFHIAKPGGWPKGKYTLHLLLNGNEVRTKDITVK